MVKTPKHYYFTFRGVRVYPYRYWHMLLLKIDHLKQKKGCMTPPLCVQHIHVHLYFNTAYCICLYDLCLAAYSIDNN